jgi:hypothetical protein
MHSSKANFVSYKTVICKTDPVTHHLAEWLGFDSDPEQRAYSVLPQL